ncbi:hypothetical protein BSY19_4838 (plasmid) [Bosea sp. RAC05]|nr:hypothetical protein BSY19_4838 [Bosea sp. RAC05]
MPGYNVSFDEASTDITAAETGGVPFAIAKKAALEELAGVLGDINEGDASGRLDDDPDMETTIEEQSTKIEATTETDYRPDAIALTDDQQKLVDALVEDGDGIGFYTQIVDETINVPATVQRWIDGEASLQDVIDDAEECGYHEKTVEIANLLLSPAPTV